MSTLYYTGSIEQALTLTKEQNSLLIIFISDDTQLSLPMEQALNQQGMHMLSSANKCPIIKLNPNSIPSMLKISVNSTPSVHFISHKEPVGVIESYDGDSALFMRTALSFIKNHFKNRFTLFNSQQPNKGNSTVDQNRMDELIRKQNLKSDYKMEMEQLVRRDREDRLAALKEEQDDLLLWKRNVQQIPSAPRDPNSVTVRFRLPDGKNVFHDFSLEDDLKSACVYMEDLYCVGVVISLPGPSNVKITNRDGLGTFGDVAKTSSVVFHVAFVNKKSSANVNGGVIWSYIEYLMAIPYNLYERVITWIYPTHSNINENVRRMDEDDDNAKWNGNSTQFY